MALPSCILTRRWPSPTSRSATSSCSTVKVSLRSQITRFASSSLASSTTFWISALSTLRTSLLKRSPKRPHYSTLKCGPDSTADFIGEQNERTPGGWPESATGGSGTERTDREASLDRVGRPNRGKVQYPAVRTLRNR